MASSMSNINQALRKNMATSAQGIDPEILQSMSNSHITTAGDTGTWQTADYRTGYASTTASTDAYYYIQRLETRLDKIEVLLAELLKEKLALQKLRK